jgi:gliding motility-associated-like protein
MKKIKTAGLFFLLLFVTTLNAQLSDFKLNVTKTDELCLDNGTLLFTVSNTTPKASILYKVYKLPNVSEAIFISSANSLSGLSAGDYKVIALQSLESKQNSKETTVTILDKKVEFDFVVTSANQSCSTGGTIIVKATSGTLSSCEVFSGPVIRENQKSNIFKDLPGGTYKVRAFDNCGNGKVKTYTLSLINSVLTISDPFYPDAVNAVCDSIKVNNVITASSGEINYPLTVKHTLTPMDISGNTIVINQVFKTGSGNSQVVSAVLPRYATQSYAYDIEVTDNCNTTYSKDDNIVDPSIGVKLALGDAKCAEKYLIVNASKYTTSYKVKFVKTPDEFDASRYLSTANPFTEPSVVFGGSENSVPFGEYIVEITDKCGRTATDTLKFQFIKPEPSSYGYNNGCFSLFGGIVISVPKQRIVSGRIINGPDSYKKLHELPLNVNVTNYIHDTNLIIRDLPLGSYTIAFTDDCGFEYEREVLVPEYIDQKFNIVSVPACTPGFGTVRFRSGNGYFKTVSIIDAPNSYKGPSDVTSILDANGELYLADLPEGIYSFKGTDKCDVTDTYTVNVVGYVPPVNTYTFTPNCGSFTVKVIDDSNGVEGATYWLQKYNTETKTWGHPQTGNVYGEGNVVAAVPNGDNSIQLYNNNERNNLNFSGRFRIVKKFETFSTGTNQNTKCISLFGVQFTYTEQFEIKAAYSLKCLSDAQANDVMIDVVGYPISFQIISKNGESIVIDNGKDNVFKNLEPAVYTFEIEDDCGNIKTKDFDVQTLPSVSDAKKPDDMVFCTDDSSVKNYKFKLTDQDDAVLGSLYSSMYSVSYHKTQADADNGADALPEYYTSTTNGEQIFVRLVNNEVALCHGTTSFKLYVGNAQQPSITTVGTICNDKKIALIASAGYDSYQWSNGETTKIIYVSEPGVYNVIAKKNYGNSYCTKYTEIEIKQSFTPQIKNVETEDWTDDKNIITVSMEGAGNYEYSVDGMNYQESNVFTDLETGVYKVYVKDMNGCGQDIKEVVLLNYPNYFTPNGDGHHDKWHIKYAIKEPNLSITIFDRYGKIITNFDSTSEGWDGTLHGIQLPSTDYWFVVKREDGREHRGHFAMLR